MLQAHRHTFKRLNMDADPALNKADEYVYLKNGIPFQHPLQDGGDGAITNVTSNSRQVNSDLSPGVNKVIGKFDDTIRNRIIYFIYNDGAGHAIYVMDSSFLFYRVIKNSLLGFSLDFSIDGVFVFGDLCIWTDNNKEIREINLAKAIAGGTYTPTLEEITLIKRPPQLTLDLHYSTNVGFTNNYIQYNFFQFYYRYIYTDNEASVWSQFGQKPDNSQGTNNRIEITLKGGEVIPKTVKQIDYAVRINQASEVTVYKSEAVSGGLHPATHYFYNDSLGATIPDAESFRWNDSIPLKSKGLGFHKNRLFLFNNTEGYNYKATPVSGIVLSTVNVADNGFKSRGTYLVGLMFFDFAGRHAGVQIGTSPSVTIPDRDNTPLVPKAIHWDISAVASADIPLWATHYSVVRTKDRVRSFFIQAKTADIFYYKKDAAGVITYNKTYLVGNNGTAIDISALPNYKIGYTFNKGDRVFVYIKTALDVEVRVEDLEIRSQDGRFIYTDLFNVGDVMFAADSTNLMFEIYTPQKSINPALFFECDERYAITNPGSGVQTFSVTSGNLVGDVVIPDTSYINLGYKYQIAGYSPTAPYSNVLVTGAGITVETMNRWNKYFDSWTDGTGRAIAFSPIGSLQQVKSNYVRFGQTYLFNAQISQLNTFEPFDEYPLPLQNGPGTALAVNDRVLVAIHEKETEAIYIGEGFVSTATGNQFLAKTDSVVGADNKYIGGYGTCHAESVIVYADRTYFFDVYKATIVRRAPDGLTAISNYGIRNFLRKYQQDNNLIINKALLKVYGGYDPLLDLCLWAFVYNGIFAFCVAFHEASNSWIGFFDYPVEGFSKLNGNLVGFLNGDPYVHYGSGNSFLYGVLCTRLLEFNIAHNGKVHVWKSIALDQDNTNLNNSISVAELSDNGAGYVVSGPGKQLTTISLGDLIQREGVWRSAIFRDINTKFRSVIFDIAQANLWSPLIGAWDSAGQSKFFKNITPGVGTVVQSYNSITPGAYGTYSFRLTAIVTNFTDPAGSITITAFPTTALHLPIGSSVSNQGPITQNGTYQFEFTINWSAGSYLELKVDKNFTVGVADLEINISPTNVATFMKYEGNPMRSQILKVKLECNRTDSAVLRAVTILSTPSEVS